MNRNIFLLAIFACFLVACEPFQEDNIDLGPLPDTPEFSWSFVEGDSNKIVVTDLSTNTFDRLWDLPGGTPSKSTLPSDTIIYTKAGTYEISLHVAAQGGGGTAFNSKQVVILNDATLDCDPIISLLTGDCGPGGKCWIFSNEAGAISVGPTYGSTEWYSSPAGGLVAEQYNDSWCFYFDGSVFEYQNSGLTVNPWEGYEAQPFELPPGTFTFIPGGGQNGVDRIVLPEGAFMGVRDSGNILDVILLTADQLVVRAQLVDQAGTPGAEGWFEQSFVAQ